MPRIAGISPNELRRRPLRMGSEIERHNDCRRCHHPGLNLRTKVSFGRREIYADPRVRQMGTSAVGFRAAIRGAIPAHFTNPHMWRR